MFIWKYWPWVQGGTERQCRLVAQELVLAGHEVTVVTHWPGVGIPRQEMDSGVRIVRLGAVAPLARAVEWINRLSPLRLLNRSQVQTISSEIPTAKTPSFLTPWVCLDLEKWFFTLSARLFFRKNRGRFDVLHVHESHWVAGLGVEIGRQYGIPVLVKEASFPVVGPFDVTAPCRQKFDALRLQADYVALTSDAAAQLAEKGVDPERIFTVPNGVVLPLTVATPADSMLVLCVANLREGDYWKRLSTVLAAWVNVHARHPKAILTILGWGDARPWKTLADKLGIAESVRFPGESLDVGSWYRQAAVFVLPSRYEGMSNALLEAQSWGVPAVVSDIPGNRAVVQDGITGVVFPVGDEPRLAAAIIRLLDSPSERRAMGLAGRRRMEEHFSMSAIASRLAAVYRHVAPPVSRT